jgi:uncharacterized lipoprotein YajG
MLRVVCFVAEASNTAVGTSCRFNIMKMTPLLTLLLGAFFFAGCASTQESASSDASESVESQDGTGSGLLMDQYKSGQIPGYRD